MRALPLFALALLAGCPPPVEDDDDAPPADVVQIGSILLSQDPGIWQASAAFAEPSETSACTVEDVAGCQFSTCDLDAAPVEPAPHLDAGAVTIATEATEATLVLADGFYTGVSTPDDVFFENGIEMIADAAGGADIEAFSITVFAPTRLQIENPPLSSVTVGLLDALPIEWNGSSEGEVVIQLFDQSFEKQARCIAATTAGAFAIPAEIIGRFPVGFGRLDITVRAQAAAALAGDRSATFAATTHATSAVGENATYNVTFAAP